MDKIGETSREGSTIATSLSPFEATAWPSLESRLGTADASPGAPQDELLQVYGVDEEGRIELQVWFDLEDMDAAIAELEAVHARFEERHTAGAAPEKRGKPSRPSVTRRTSPPATGMLSAKVVADDILVEDRRRAVNAGIKRGRDAEIANLRAVADVGITYTASRRHRSPRGRLVLTRASVGDGGSAEFSTDALSVVEINSDNQIAAIVMFELDDFDAAVEELDARYLAGEAAAHA